jgi:leader peptidase (prepilin peptidase)/N-methyltransferase
MMHFFASFFIVIFGIAFWIDLKTCILPNWITLSLILMGLSFNAMNTNHFCSIQDAVIGLFIGYVFIRFVNFIYLKLLHQNGIGQGDAKLLGAIGSILGYQMVFPVLFFAALLGLIYGLIITRHQSEKMSRAFPFGPFLSVVTGVIIASKISF